VRQALGEGAEARVAGEAAEGGVLAGPVAEAPGDDAGEGGEGRLPISRQRGGA
jgi:hypothetical protein